MGLIVSEDDGATWSTEAVIRADGSDGDRASDAHARGLVGTLTYSHTKAVPKVKWSIRSGHQVKALKCHSEVKNDNGKTIETKI